MLKYQGAQGATKAAEFWRKNLDKPIPLEQLEQFTAVLQQEPEALYSNASGYAKEARTGVTNWLFRRLSKMGLDWMIKTQSAQSDTTNVWFLDAALTNPGSSSSDLQALTPDMFESHPYKANSSAKNTYGPITYSERRHLERNIASNDLYLRRTKLLSLKEVKSYRG
jgi:insecticidal toxin complex protein TccC